MLSDGAELRGDGVHISNGRRLLNLGISSATDKNEFRLRKKT
jgi:hypothetical protein